MKEIVAGFSRGEGAATALWCLLGTSREDENTAPAMAGAVLIAEALLTVRELPRILVEIEKAKARGRR